VKKTLFPLPLILTLLVSCDFDERTITDPAEMVEKGINLANRRSYLRSKPLLEKAVRLLDEQPTSTLQLEAYSSLVGTQIGLGEFSSAVGRIEAARKLAKKLADFRAEAGLAVAEGDLFAAVGDLSKSISAYATAKQLSATFGDHDRALNVDLRAARTLLWNGRVLEADEAYQSLLQSEQSNNTPAIRAETLLGVGRVFRLRNQLVESTNSLAQALERADPSDQPILRSRILHELGLVQLSRQAVTVAIEHYRDGVNVLRRARERRDYEVLLLFRIGEAYTRLGRSGDAQKYFTDAMDIAKILGDRVAENYLLLWIVKANYASMTPVQRKQSIPRLLQSYEQIAKHFQECGHRTGEGLAYYEFGVALQQAGELERARDAFQNAVRVQALSRWDFLDVELHQPYLESFGVTETKQEWFDALANSLIVLNRPVEALRVVELARLRSQNARLENVEIQFRHPQLKSRANDLRAELYSLRLRAKESSAKLGNQMLRGGESDAAHTQPRFLEIALGGFRQTAEAVIAQHLNYAPLFPTDQVPLNDVQQFIPRGAVVVEYILAHDRLAIIAITRSQMIVKFSSVGRDSLLRLVHSYQQLLNDPSVFAAEANAADVPAMTRFSILSTTLYDALIRPLDELHEKNLVVVANEAFGSFPFHALERQDRNTVRYVIEARSVDYISSLASLKFRTTTTSRIRDIVAFGNPTGKQWSVDYELRDVRSFFKNARINIGLETSWNNVRSATGDVLQISTEFTEPKATTPLGGINLSNGLMVEESETVPFEKLMEQTPSAVVVLSNQSSQGLALQSIHALVIRMNGTADVFLNCWSADRKSAKFFSEFFYTHLSNGLAPGDAYRQALINLLHTREVSHPHSWAQFFHFGIG
jgi:tetratricopeptide (TPR) repeat protein